MRHLFALCLSAFALAAGTAAAEDEMAVSVAIKDHKFTPAEISVPAHKRVVVTVSNDDATPEEFESHDLNFEKVIPGNTKAVVRFGPVAAGRYNFFGEFHEDTAQGTVVVE